MVGGDNTDRSSQQLRPKGIPLRSVSQWRSALRDCSQTFNIFFCKEKIVRAGLDGNIGAARPSFGSQRDAAPRADVNDMQLGAGLLGQQGGALNRFELGNYRTRCKENADAVRFLQCKPPR